MYCSSEISRKIKYMSFLAAVGVVCLHTGPTGYDKVPKWVKTMTDWWMGFHSWGVPFFFIVSGFFFDRGVFGRVEVKKWKDLLEWYRGFIGKKWKTLMMPYLLWGAAFGGLLWTPLWMLTNTRNGVSLYANTFLGEPTVWLSLDKLFGILRNGPANPTLWFVRVLIVAFLFAPVWLFIRKISRWLLVAISIFAVCWFTPVTWVSPLETLFCIGGMPVELKVQGLAWFGVGMSISAFKIEELKLPIWLAIGSFFGWCILQSSGDVGDVKYFPLFIIPAIWGAADVALPYLPDKVPEWMTRTFWLYCCHGPLSGWIGGGVRSGAWQKRGVVRLVANDSLVGCCGVLLRYGVYDQEVRAKILQYLIRRTRLI